MSDFASKYGPWAIVTGASSGIGAEIAKQVASKRVNVILVARREQKLTQVSEFIKSEYEMETMVLLADLADSAAVENILTQTKDMDVGLLVNNAGRVPYGSFFRTDLSDHMKAMNVNARSAVVLAHGLGRRLLKRGRGGMMLVSSLYRYAVPWLATYCATKGFLSNLAYVLKHELEPHGINVLAIEPALVKTEMTETDFMKIPQPYTTPDFTASESIAAFEKNSLRITPGAPPDEKADAALKNSMEHLSDQMKAAWESEIFKPSY